jgi:hypothetical protein
MRVHVQKKMRERWCIRMGVCVRERERERVNENEI